MKKPVYKSKTIWFGLFVVLIPFLGDILNLIEGSSPAWLVTLIGAIIVVLRFVTREPVAIKKEKNQVMRF